MNTYNLIIIGFIIAASFILLWWAFNTVRRIDIQKNFCAIPLTSIAKLWRRANFVPEDAKERESLYLYRDFLRKFDESECKYPIMVKDGGVRCMTRKEYDDLCGQKNIAPISPLMTILSLLVAVAAVAVNLLITKTLWIGIVLACILPVLQIIMALFVARFNKDKNSYRDGIFMALRENSVAFLRITKPFIIVDAYPHKFGKNKQPLYAALGTLTEEQVIETRDFIIRQKEAETKVVLNNVDNGAEIQRITDKTTKKPPLKAVSKIVAAEEKAANSTATPQAAAPTTTTRNSGRGLSNEEKAILIENLINDNLEAEVNRAIKKAEQENAVPEVVEDLEPLHTAEPTEVAAPAEDDFSLDAIGQALDAEIARRSKKGK